jgi:hypothetical protein
MRVTHRFQMHALCPFFPDREVWDYYTVRVVLDRVVDVHAIERVIASCCGMCKTQEAIYEVLVDQLREICGDCHIVVTGKHSANSETIVDRGPIGSE